MTDTATTTAKPAVAEKPAVAAKKPSIAPVSTAAVVLKRVPLANIVNCKSFPYRAINKEHVTSLVESIRRSGLDVPLIVWGGKDANSKMKLSTGEFPSSFLIAGLHRREALRELAKDSPDIFNKFFKEGIPVVVRYGEQSDALLAQLRENLQRQDPTADQVLPVLNKLIELNVKQNVIAARIGKSTAWVSRIIDAKETLGDGALEDVSSGNTSLRTALKAAEKVKAAKKDGKEISASDALDQVKSEASAKPATKKVSLKALYARFKALPASHGTLGDKITILQGMIEYAIGESAKFPAVLKVAAAPAKKAVVGKKPVKKV